MAVANSHLDEASVVSDVPSRARVVRALRRMIAGGMVAQGEALPSERILAKQLDVARGTVRAAMRELASEGVIAGSRPRSRRRIKAASPAGRLMSRTVVLVTLSPAEHVTADQAGRMPHGYDTYTLATAAAAIQRQGLHMLHVNPLHLMEHDDVGALVGERPFGVLVATDAGNTEQGMAIMKACAAADIPVVALGDTPAQQAFDRVAPDHEQGAYELTRWLLGQGRRRIVRFWCGGEYDAWLHHRDRGYERAMGDAGLEPLPAVCAFSKGCDRPPREEFDWATRALAGFMLELINTHAPDAVMVGADPQCYAVAGALKLLGRWPWDVPIVGYDNDWADSSQRQWAPSGADPVATVDKDNASWAAMAVQLLLDRVGGKLPAGQPQRRLVPGRVVQVPRGQSSMRVMADVTENGK